ncbi:MAG: peptidylprolyl isomerase [Candidatus Omnitrophica bacterium]|nr:peptidylprolyl isomerase [Candidatus Omnitrophota bacterium]
MMRLIFFFLTAIVLFLNANPVFAELQGAIVAIVNGAPITNTDVDELIAPLFQQYKNSYQGDELKQKLAEARADILQQLIEDKLILQEAAKKKLKVEKEEVERLIDELRSNFPSSADFEAALKNQNTTLGEVRKRYEEQLLIKKAVEVNVLSIVSVSPKEINDYYDREKDRFQTPEQIRLRNIFLSTEENTAAEAAEKKIYEIYDQLEQGAPFAELVEKYSEAPNVVDGGNMGTMQRGTLRKEIEDAVFTLNIGAYSKPVRTPLGFYIFAVDEKIPPAVPPLEDIKNKIRQKIYQDKVRISLREWIAKIKASALIEVKHETKEKS